MNNQVKTTFRQPQTSRSYPTLDPRSGVLVADGYGVRIAIERGHLTISDGAGRDRRERRIPKVGHGIRRLVVIGHTGTISLDALRWLDRVGISLAHYDNDLTLLAASGHETVGNARLRRAQVLAHDTTARFAIVGALLDAKLAGQARNTRDYLDDHATADRLDQHRASLADVDDVLPAREIEATAALDYFAAWRNNVGFRWATRDRDRVPDHWRTFAGRRSQIAKTTNTRATDPVNATLNYLYALGEVECRRACLVLGLDPGLGFLHADAPARDSLALDLIEAIRPAIDAHVLALAARHVFTAHDFAETDDGQCRILPPLTHHLAATLPEWETAVAPFAEMVAHAIADTSPYKIHKTKPLTGATRSATAAANQANKRKKSESSLSTPRRQRAIDAKGSCQHCGGPIGPHASMYCADCWPLYREQGRQLAVANAAAALVTPEAREAKRQVVSDGRLAAIDREMAVLGFTPEDWSRIAPAVRRLTLRQIMDATDLAISQASRVKSGKNRPHPRLWHALAAAVGGDVQQSSPDVGSPNGPSHRL